MLRIQPADGHYIDEIAGAFASTHYLGAVIEPRHNALHRTQSSVATYQPRRFLVRPLPESFDEDQRGLIAALTRLWRQCRTILREARRADLLFIFLPTFRGALSALAARILGKPVIVYLGTHWPEVVREDRRWSRNLQARLLRPLYVATTRLLERGAMWAAGARIVTGAVLQKAYGNLPGPTVQTPPVVNFDLELARSRRLATEAAGRRLGQPLTLLYMGALRPVKNLSRVLRAVALLRSRGESVRLLLAGNGAEEAALRRQAQALGLTPDACIFLGYISDPAEKANLYAEADALILASHAEGFPRVIYEALATGLPVVASALPGIQAGVPAAGISWIDPGSTDSIAAGISRALHRPSPDPALRDAQRIASAAFSIKPSEVALELIETLLGNTPAAQPRFTRPDWND